MRYAFDSSSIPYDLIYKERVREGNLKRAYDVIVMPTQAGSGQAAGVRHRRAARRSPYKKSDQFKFLGDVRRVGRHHRRHGRRRRRRVRQVPRRRAACSSRSAAASFFPAEFGLAPTVDAARTIGAFYAPGAIIDAEILQPEHPIFYGYDKKTIPVRYGGGPLLTVQTGANPFDGPPATPPPTPQGVLMRYPGGDEHVLSGLMRGANEIRNRPAIVDQPARARAA